MIKRGIEVPNELTMLELWFVEPYESVPEEGYWSYRFTDEENITLEVAFNVFEMFLRITTYINGHEIYYVSHEGTFRLEPIKVGEQHILQAIFEHEEISTR